MLLKNFGSMAASLPLSSSGSLNILGILKTTTNKVLTSSSGAASFTKFPMKVCNYDNYNINLVAAYNSETAEAYTSPHSLCLILGDGDTPPTVDDCKLAGNLVALECIKQGTSTSNEGFVTTASSTGFTIYGAFRNNTEAPVTIKEIALAVCHITSSASTYPMWILTRDVLAQPVTLEVGAAKTFEVAVDTMSFVTNAG